jgi:hypothetical protein
MVMGLAAGQLCAEAGVAEPQSAHSTAAMAQNAFMIAAPSESQASRVPFCPHQRSEMQDERKPEAPEWAALIRATGADAAVI